MNAIKGLHCALALAAALPVAAQTFDETARRNHFFPLLVDGGGFRTHLLLTNVADGANGCVLDLRGAGLNAGRFESKPALSVSDAGATIDLAAGASLILASRGEQSLAAFGYGKLDCVEPVAARSLLSLSDSGAPISMAVKESARPGTTLQLPLLPRLGRMALALANDANLDAVCALELEDAAGRSLGGASLTVPARSLAIEFLDDLVANPDAFDSGVATLSCGREVAVLGLPLSGPVFTALPSIDLINDQGNSSHILPLIADGDGFRSQPLITNLADGGNRCMIDFYGAGLDAGKFTFPSGAAAAGSGIAFELTGKGDQAAIPSAGGPSLVFGYAAVECDGPVAALNVLTAGPSDNPAGMTVVPSTPNAAEMRFPLAAELGGWALILNNDSERDASCDIWLTSGGERLPATAAVPIPPRSSAVRFLNELFVAPPEFREGELAIDCDGDVAALKLLLNGAAFAAMVPAIPAPASPGAGPTPAFAADINPGDLNFSNGAAIWPLQLPPASEGGGALTYSLSPSVPGLTFDSTTRRLVGTPSAAGVYEMTYTATDSNGNSDSVDFLIAVRMVDDAFVEQWSDLEPESWWMESEPYSCARTEKQTSPWLDAGLQDLGGSDPLSLIRYHGNGSYLRYGNMGFFGCTRLINHPDAFYNDPPADPTYYSLGDLEIKVDIARVPPDASGWFQDDGARVDMSMAEAVGLLNTYVATYYRRVSQGLWRVTFTAGEEFDVAGDGSPTAAIEQQYAIVDACSGGCLYGAPGGLNRMLLNDVARDTAGQGYNGWARFGLASLLVGDTELIVHEMGHAWMSWPHSHHEALMRGSLDAPLEPPNPYRNRYDVMSSLGRIRHWDSELPATLAINRYSAGWIRPQDVALHLVDNASYTLSKPFAEGHQLLVVHSGRRHAFTTLEVLEERHPRYRETSRNIYDPNVPGQRRARRYEGVLVSRYDQTGGTGAAARFGPALYHEDNPRLRYDLFWGRDDYSLIADGETRDIGGGVSVAVSKNADGSFDVTVAGGKVAPFETWCPTIWFSGLEFDAGCLLNREAALIGQDSP